MKMQMKMWVAGVCSSVLMGAMLPAIAEDAPLSYKASPAVYKVIAEDEHLRLGIATWQPGQKDEFHSHPDTAFYTLKPCHARVTTPDGKTFEVNWKPGEGRINGPVQAHTFENLLKTECQQLFVELKK